MNKKRLMIIMIICLLTTTICYCGLSTSLAITSEAVFRAQADIRVTGIERKEIQGNVVENYKAQYNVKTTTMGLTMTEGSEVEYEVEVTNNGNIDETIYGIEVQKSSEGIECEIDKEKEEGIIGFKEKKKYKVTCRASKEGTYNVVIKYDFRGVYYVTYNEGNIERQIKYEDVTLKLSEEEPEKEGYEFKGWSSLEEGEIEYISGSNYERNESVILYGIYESKIRTKLKIEPNEGEIDEQLNKEGYKGQEIQIKDPTREGYEFKGWEVISGDGEIEGRKYTYKEEDTTIRAKWEANTYTITLNKNGGTSAGTTSVTATYDSTSLTPRIITKPKKEYTITYNGNNQGATYIETGSTKVEYTLKGWYTASSGGKKLINNSNEVELQTNVEGYTDIEGNWKRLEGVTVYSQWEEGILTLPVISKTGYECKWKKGTESYEGGEIINNIEEDTTFVAECTDIQEPTLSLSKETYKEGFEGWTFTNSYVDNERVLILGENLQAASATSDYYLVDGERWRYTWDAYTTSPSSNSSPNGGVNTTSHYYNSNFENVKSQNGYSGNGYASNLSINTWSNNLSHNGWNGYGENVKYLKVYFYTGNEYSQPVTKIRNLKVYGQMYNTFYLIKVNASDNVGVTTKKYAKGEKTKEYFKTNGTIFISDEIRVEENGKYTIYVEDAEGNGTIQVIEITKIRSNLEFNNQSKSIKQSGRTQEIQITGASNNKGEVIYSEISERNSSNEATDYFTINGTTITAKEKVPVGEYKYKVRATDKETRYIKEAEITITVEEKRVIVTAEGNGGSINETSGWSKAGSTSTKSVVYDGTYGTLPTVRKTGYTFKGWTANLDLPIKAENYIFTHYEGRTTSELKIDTDNRPYIRINGYSVPIDTEWSITSKNNVLLKPNTEYTLSFYVRSENSQEESFMARSDVAIRGLTKIVWNNGSESTLNEHIYFEADGEWHLITMTVTSPSGISSGHFVIGNDIPNIYGEGSYIDIKDIQLTELKGVLPYYISSSTKVAKEENHTIKAEYEINKYKLTVNPNGGKWNNTTSNSEIIEEYGTIKEITNPSENAKYTISYNGNSQGATYTASVVSVERGFSGWSLSGNGIYSNGTYTYEEGDGTLTANYNSTSNTFTLPEISKNGYTCKWAKGSASGTQYSSGAGNQTITENTTYFAVCTEKTYTLTVNPNGGSIEGSTSNKTYNMKYSDVQNIPTPTRTGYTFTGYQELSNGSHGDGRFETGNNNVGVYYNTGNGVVTVSRQTKSTDNPVGNYEMVITNSGTETTPGLGGFYHRKQSEANKKYIHVFIAKLPVGYYLHNANNSLGTGATTKWLTSNEGTGKWQTYAYQVNAGTSGTFDTFGHVYISKLINATWDRWQIETGAVTMYLAYSNIFDITDDNNGFGMYDGSGVLTAQWKDTQKPSITDFSVTKTKTTFTLNITAQDKGSGITKIKWYYKSCTSENYTSIAEDTMSATTEKITKTKPVDSCLNYCTYTAYAEVEDEEENKETTQIIEFTLDIPTTNEVLYENTRTKSKCTTLKCVLEELYRKIK